LRESRVKRRKIVEKEIDLPMGVNARISGSPERRWMDTPEPRSGWDDFFLGGCMALKPNEGYGFGGKTPL